MQVLFACRSLAKQAESVYCTGKAWKVQLCLVRSLSGFVVCGPFRLFGLFSARWLLRWSAASHSPGELSRTLSTSKFASSTSFGDHHQSRQGMRCSASFVCTTKKKSSCPSCRDFACLSSLSTFFFASNINENRLVALHSASALLCASLVDTFLCSLLHFVSCFQAHLST